MVVTEADLDAVEAGLDALDLAPSGPPAPSRLRTAAEVVLPKLAAVVLLLGLWRLEVLAQIWPTYKVPDPIDVWHLFTDELGQGTVSSVVWTSVSHGAVGYAIALAIGTPLGLLIARVRLIRLGIGSMVAALQSLPSVAWVPFAVVLIGLNQRMIYFIVIMGAFPSIAGGMVSAIDQTSPMLLNVGRALGARGLALYRHVIIPAALPGYVAGMKQAWSFSWRSLMAAEIIAPDPKHLGVGLGTLLKQGSDNIDMPSIIVSIILILLVGVAVETFVFAPLTRAVYRRRGLTGA